jgi:hypothetical protein
MVKYRVIGWLFGGTAEIDRFELGVSECVGRRAVPGEQGDGGLWSQKRENFADHRCAVVAAL